MPAPEPDRSLVLGPASETHHRSGRSRRRLWTTRLDPVAVVQLVRANVHNIAISRRSSGVRFLEPQFNYSASLPRCVRCALRISQNSTFSTDDALTTAPEDGFYYVGDQSALRIG